ncbi:MAG: Phthalate 4,5-dioxygenase oxygenase reductase subunit [Paracidovorax wautersii]|uniref:Phthalate 4,5-dioxygenase oxygenase reductase subunit n=1 Tax=Paracidovorax wautersii TaxID=1177982 RepID=A0A7V8FS64_9BURK|nr:MAG: Phthalate 4,5-dioxygenase oxygenase reductase subunit [Paracidovorax wautersii]
MTAQASLRVKVARRTLEAEGICGLELVAADGGALVAFSAGSHIDLFLPGGIVRQYSLCNDPTESHRYQIAVLRDPASRGGSAAVHEQLKVGDELTISVPRNHFALAGHAPSHLLMAGGIGITPILCMAERLSALKAEFTLHYACRTPERAAFRQRIADSAFAARAHFHFDQERPLDIGQVLGAAAADAHVYVCGPQGFMDAVLDTARALGWDPSRLHWEFFAAAQPTHRSSDQAFDVRLASSGRVVSVGPDKTVTQALADAGVDVMVSCEQGVCGTCLTRVLEGEVDHRDAYLTPQEQALHDQFTPCCSRARSACLVLDL